MTEYSEVFDVILNYTRKVVVKPTEPTFESVKTANPDFNIDNLLDVFSDLKQEYNKKLEKYEENDTVVTSFVFITEDENFMKNVKNFEKNDFFIHWTDSAKKLINHTLSSLV
jgi:hypothetical protein